MAPTPYRIAQTSTELKKQHRKNGPRLNERQQKQLERDFELDQRAARAREAEERRKAAKKKSEEKEVKEAAARKQMGVGLATQLIGYSRTQAQLKNGMEAFLGLKKRKEEEKRKKEEELTKKLEAIAEDIEKEPWDDDNDDDIALDFPVLNRSFGEQWADDDLDDDSLLQAHDLIMSDPLEETPVLNPQSPPVPVPSVIPPSSIAPISPKPVPVKADINFTRTHGPTNKTIEAILDKLPQPLIELLSQDLSLDIPNWNPVEGLLHKLNPAGLPPHRLRIKVGCVVTLLRDLDASSQLSESQHLCVLRSENDRVECLVLDGQLEGTKTVLTRLPFVAKYKGLDQHPYKRIQFPIRVATDYTPSDAPRDTSQTRFKMPSVPGRLPSESLPRKPVPHVAKTKSSANLNPVFKLPGLPASKSSSLASTKSISITKPVSALASPPIDCWDDFLESSTQISRDLAAEVAPKASEPRKALVIAPSALANCLPPMSTQDLDFSLDDLDEELSPKAPLTGTARAEQDIDKAMPAPLASLPVAPEALQKTDLAVFTTLPAKTTGASTTPNSSKPLRPARKIAGRCLNPGPFATGIEYQLSKLRPSQLPKSMGGPWKRKTIAALSPTSSPPAKKQCVSSSRTAVLTNSKGSFEEFILSTQEVASFLDDNDDFGFGSPPIAA
ncbi:hypothetical protein HRS9122_02798 [Pyrenophora teres f. teres]|nr:hypothetical protein HRS9122_02798 [Pyrenophora teres f. teres]